MPAEPLLPPKSRSSSLPWSSSFSGRVQLVAWSILGLGTGLVLLGLGSHHRVASGDFVVAYVSQDQVYAEPILAEFTRETGVAVRSIFDSEAVKTVALANRLIAERNRPQCDVYWGSEELRTRQLAARDLFDGAGHPQSWAAVGHR